MDKEVEIKGGQVTSSKFITGGGNGNLQNQRSDTRTEIFGESLYLSSCWVEDTRNLTYGKSLAVRARLWGQVKEQWQVLSSMVKVSF